MKNVVESADGKFPRRRRRRNINLSVEIYAAFRPSQAAYSEFDFYITVASQGVSNNCNHRFYKN